jgi:hypothetical protein
LSLQLITVFNISSFCEGYLKENVYKSKPHPLDGIKQNIQYCILKVTTETVRKVANNMMKIEDACIAERTGHFQHLF